MTWTKYTTRYLRKQWQADVLGALGKSCHVVGLGLILGMCIGTWPVAGTTLLAVAVAAGAGAMSTFAAGSVRRSAEELPEAQERTREARVPIVNLLDAQPPLESEPRFVELLDRQRDLTVGGARGM